MAKKKHSKAGGELSDPPRRRLGSGSSLEDAISENAADASQEIVLTGHDEEENVGGTKKSIIHKSPERVRSPLEEDEEVNGQSSLSQSRAADVVGPVNSQPTRRASSPAIVVAREEDFQDDGDTKTWPSRTKKKLGKGLLFFIPKVERVPWDAFISLSVVGAIPAAVYLLFFTKMGFGLTTFYFLAEKYEQYAVTLGVALGAFTLLLYILDISYWDSKLGIFSRYSSYFLVSLGILLLVLFMSTEYPYGPICLFTVITPLWLIFVKMVLLPKKTARVYVSWLSGPLFFLSVIIFILWIIWILVRDENEWNEIIRLQDTEESGCEPDFEDYENCRKSPESDEVCFSVDTANSEIDFPEGCDESCTNVFDSCLNTFILWVGPLLVSLSYVFLSFFCTFLRIGRSSEKDIGNFVKLWTFLLFTMWVTASLAGAGVGLTAALFAFTLCLFIGSGVFLMVSFSLDDRKAHRKEVLKKLKEKYGSHLDTLRGLLVVTCAPVALVYVGMSFVNQCVRRLKVFPCSKNLKSADENTDEHIRAEDKDWVTRKTRRQIETFRSWDRSKVYTNAVYWGIAFMTLQVIVAQFTILFLSWLIEKTSSMALGAVTGIMIAVGLIMFLLPPVPGVPIYLTMGIVLVAIGRDSIGLVWSMVYCAAISLALKLLACTLQQKLIGETLSGYVTVRQFVGINTRLIRAMKLVLAERGLGVAKVSILIGGPDWPTSVLCGIMRLNLIPILVGTLPVIFLIVPTLLTGSFTYMASLRVDGSPEFPWAGTVAAIFAALTAIVQFGSMIVAAFFLESAASSRMEELDAMPVDQEVKEADDKSERINKIYKDVTQWHLVPLWAKIILLLSVATMIVCCYMVQLFSNSCFSEYELTYTIDDNLDGDWKNLILPLGRAALLLFVVSMVLLKIYTSWATRRSVLISEGRAILPGSPSSLESRTEEQVSPGIENVGDVN